MSNSVFFEFTQHTFPVILPCFLYTHTHTHTLRNTKHTFLWLQTWEPLKKRSLGHNARPVGLCTFYKHTFLSFSLIVLLSDFQYHVSVVHDAPHINTTKSTTVVLVYKYIPFFQHKVYTFFYRGGILSVILWNNNHFTPKEGFPKNCVPDGAKELSTQGLFCVWN